MTAEDVLGGHRLVRHEAVLHADTYSCSCKDVGASKMGVTTNWHVHAGHQLDALKSAGYAVVELPKQMTDRSYVAECLRSLPMWTADTAWTCLREPDLIEFEGDNQNVYGDIGIAEARNLAAALLAAADAAESADA